MAAHDQVVASGGVEVAGPADPGVGRPRRRIEPVVVAIGDGARRPDVAAPRDFRDALLHAGIDVPGDRPWDMHVHDALLFARVRRHGLPGLGDAYVDGWWDCEAIDEFFYRALKADLPRRLRWAPDVLLTYLTEKVVNLQSLRRAVWNIRAHYNLGNDLFQATLDPYLMYTCGYWKNAANLDEAQVAKMDLICRKVGLESGMRVLDLGCGWGGFAKFAAERYGASVVAVTLSDEQASFAREFCRGLPVEVRLADYRTVQEKFDRVISIGMMEHVGPKNYRTCLRTIDRCLSDDGLCLLHFFASPMSFPNLSYNEVIWITRHIFPALVCPSLAQVGRAMEGLFILEDLHNFGADYEPTLLAWYDNFERSWMASKGQKGGLAEKYGERFFRMWRYYLLSCAGAFRLRKYQLWQLVLSKHGVPGGYRTIR
jgi:cyclopropane-fatty-acyl-phospholipid synthase